MGDLDLDAIEAAGHRGAVPSQRMTLALVSEVRHLRDLLTRAIPHIDPNDSDDAHRLLVECEEATRG